MSTGAVLLAGLLFIAFTARDLIRRMWPVPTHESKECNVVFCVEVYSPGNPKCFRKKVFSRSQIGNMVWFSDDVRLGLGDANLRSGFDGHRHVLYVSWRWSDTTGIKMQELVEAGFEEAERFLPIESSRT